MDRYSPDSERSWATTSKSCWKKRIASRGVRFKMARPSVAQCRPSKRKTAVPAAGFQSDRWPWRAWKAGQPLPGQPSRPRTPTVRPRRGCGHGNAIVEVAIAPTGRVGPRLQRRQTDEAGLQAFPLAMERALRLRQPRLKECLVYRLPRNRNDHDDRSPARQNQPPQV